MDPVYRRGPRRHVEHGKPVTDFFRPLSLMRNGPNTSWSCSVHIVSDSTSVFKGAPGKMKNSLLPDYNLRNS
eukprot:7838678-Pyramimonas_sp.AAC.1